MNSKQAIEELKSRQLPEPPSTQKPGAQGDAARVWLGRGGTTTLPAHFLEGTAWDEV
jgi:hypothetical protein